MKPVTVDLLVQLPLGVSPSCVGCHYTSANSGQDMAVRQSPSLQVRSLPRWLTPLSAICCCAHRIAVVESQSAGLGGAAAALVRTVCAGEGVCVTPAGGDGSLIGVLVVRSDSVWLHCCRPGVEAVVPPQGVRDEECRPVKAHVTALRQLIRDTTMTSRRRLAADGFQNTEDTLQV